MSDNDITESGAEVKSWRGAFPDDTDPDDTEGHARRAETVTQETDDVEGHHFRTLAASDSDDVPEADDTEGHGFRGI